MHVTTKKIIIRYKNHERIIIQDAYVNLLLIFEKYYFGMFFGCGGKVLLSGSSFSICRFDIYMIFIYIVIASNGVLLDFCGIYEDATYNFVV